MNGLEELNKKKIKFRRKTYRDKKLKDCRGCVYSDENPEVLSSPCYMCKRNFKDNRIDWYEETKNEDCTRC